ncbi:L-lactate dehydrogenase [Clostridium hydrogenum]|uniref:L-lactate dehydrogenase n=1 Tax=Clostridium hydrogenum TaxID=2855764 RepID=UPI001EEEE81B|nr:L-lactate dehydrogenase [Clostridium hydrogenum]
MKITKNKIVLVGAGMVGSSILNSILSLNLVAEIALIDNNINKAEGEALDASHTTSFPYSPNVRVRVGEYKDCADAQIIIVSAGPSKKPNENISRLDLAAKNVNVMKSVMESICEYTKEAIIIIVTNPVDILTYYAQNNFDYPKEKIIGTGTFLDTARFIRILAENYLVDTKNVQGYILGEHGESAFAAWSLVSIAGVPINKWEKLEGNADKINRDEVLDRVKQVGTDILNLKGYTSAGIATSVCTLVKAILLNELSIVPVSVTLDGEYGLKDVALSIPCLISDEGVSKKIEVPLTEDEVKKLSESAEVLKRGIATVVK